MDGIGWGGRGWNAMGKEGKTGQGKEKRLQTIVGETSKNVLKICEKEELGRISYVFKVKYCNGLTELIRSAVFKNK